MGFLVRENTNFQHRPMLLKDFLRDDAPPSPWSTVALSSKSTKSHIVLLRSWSKRAAATKISAVHKVIKLLQFATKKSPSSSISRKLTKIPGKGENDTFVGDVQEVKVKDILRWRSFRDMAEDDPMPLISSPERSAASCSDFTAVEVAVNEEFGLGKNVAALKNAKGDWSFEEYDQQSPVSVLDSPFRQVQEPISPIHRANANYLQRASPELSLKAEEDDGEILRVEKSWMEGDFEESYEWEVEEKRESYIKDMERGICWNKFGEEEGEMCKELEIRIFNDLMDDFVAEFHGRLYENFDM